MISFSARPMSESGNPARSAPELTLDREFCRRACDARDARFDGLFFIAIVTTGIYCRPVCPARRVPLHRCRFFPTAAASEEAGFRPCMRCRPELAPGRATVDAVPRLAAMASVRIAEGALNGRSIDELATEFGVCARQLRRAVKHELGVTPTELAQTHRLLLAKQLLTDTRMTVSRVAFASGFQSLRRFNALFRQRYRINPLALRRRRAGAAEASAAAGDDLLLRLSYRPPLAWDELLRALRQRAIPGVEQVDATGYRRTVRIGADTGIVGVEVRSDSRGPAVGGPPLQLRISATLLPSVMALLPRTRALLDLDAEPELIDAHLRKAGLAPLVDRRPGLRVPGSFDAFETALRVLLEHTDEAHAVPRKLARLAEHWGEPIASAESPLARLFPTASRLAEVDAGSIEAQNPGEGLGEAIVAISRLIATGRLRLGPGADPALAIAVLDECLRAAVRSGPSTPALAETIARRAMSWPDSFDDKDESLAIEATACVSSESTQRTIESWRPWRAYAGLHLWFAAADRLPGDGVEPIRETREANSEALAAIS
ncbi:MAG: AlkA N-terminal domain-containing protein [Gemmatimonadota bacterium]